MPNTPLVGRNFMGFFDILIKPEPTMQGMLKDANLGAAIKNFAIYGAVVGLVLGVLIAIVVGLLGAVLASLFGPAAGIVSTMGFAAIIVLPILFAIMVVIFSFISYGLIWLVAKVLGGKGPFTNTYYLASKILWPVLVVTIVVQIIMFALAMIPGAGIAISGLVSLLFSLYMLYLIVVLISIANSISKIKAIVVMLVLLVIVVILAFIFALSMIASIMAMAGSGAMASGLAGY